MAIDYTAMFGMGLANSGLGAVSTGIAGIVASANQTAMNMFAITQQTNAYLRGLDAQIQQCRIQADTAVTTAKEQTRQVAISGMNDVWKSRMEGNRALQVTMADTTVRITESNNNTQVELARLKTDAERYKAEQRQTTLQQNTIDTSQFRV